MRIISISELYLTSESVDTVKKMFYNIVNFYVDTERPLIIITGDVQVAMNTKDSDQVKMAVGILEKHQFGFIRITVSSFRDFSLFTDPRT